LTSRLTALVGVLGLAATGLLAGQQPSQPVFRTAVDLVQLDVRVVDENGQFVRDLRQDEFRIFEDNVPQSIATFSLVDIPIERSKAVTLAGRRIESDVSSNDDPANGRLYVLVMDDRALAAIDDRQDYMLRAPSFRAIAREFVEHHVTDNDRVAIVTTSGRPEVGSEFTNNQQRLVAAIERFEAGYGQVPQKKGNDLVFDTLHSALQSVKDIAAWLTQLPGRRKAVVLISQSFGRDYSDHAMMAEQAEDLRQLFGETARANVGIYILDAVGLRGAQADRIKPVFIDDGAEFNLERKGWMQDIAEGTGGFALTASNAYSEAFDRIVQETSSYYLLGYSSTNTRQEKTPRKLRVEVTRPGLTVRTRSSYVAEKPAAVARGAKPSATPSALDDLIRSPLPVPGLSMQVSTAAFRGRGDRASVALILEARGRDLQFTERNGRLEGSLAVLMSAGSVTSSFGFTERGALNLRMSPGTHAAVTASGVRVVHRFDAPPGLYQIKLAAVDTSTRGEKGVVAYDFTVPDFSKGLISMSGVALASAEASQVPTTGTDQSWLKLLETLPTTRREFRAGDQLRQYVEIYDNRRRPDHQLDVRIVVQRESGEIVHEQNRWFEQIAREFSATRSLVTNIPLKGFEPGRYVLTVDARSSLEPDKSVTREVPFSVR
jgi:VWFA-related protein